MFKPYGEISNNTVEALKKKLTDLDNRYNRLFLENRELIDLIKSLEAENRELTNQVGELMDRLEY